MDLQGGADLQGGCRIYKMWGKSVQVTMDSLVRICTNTDAGMWGKSRYAGQFGAMQKSVSALVLM